MTFDSSFETPAHLNMTLTGLSMALHRGSGAEAEAEWSLKPERLHHGVCVWGVHTTVHTHTGSLSLSDFHHAAA